MSVKRAIIVAIATLAVLALPMQAIIDSSIDNIACACLVLGSSLLMLVYIGCTDALRTQPLSTFALLGFCVTTQLGALLVQTSEWTPIRNSLYDPLNTFAVLAFYQAIAMAVHFLYRFFSGSRHGGVHLFRGLLGWLGLYITPRVSALWFMGCIGLFSYLVFESEAVLASIIGKIGLAFNFLSWAPFLIPIYLREYGDAYCNWRLNRIFLALYTVALVGLGLVLNTRGVMFFGIATIGFLFLLAGLRSDAPIKWRSLRNFAVALIILLCASGPVSDLVTSMAIARGLGKVPVMTKIERTIQVWQRPDLIAAYRADKAAETLYKAYDEHYVSNPVLSRFVLTKFYDNSLHFAKRITTDDARSRLTDVSEKFFWAVLPGPAIDFLGVDVEKRSLDFSMGDYLPYLTAGGPLGGHRGGSMVGQGIALFGPLFPFLFAFICLILFGLMDLLTIRHRVGMSTVSALGMLQIWIYFVDGLSYEGLHDVFYFALRNFWQVALIYAAVFGAARLLLREHPQIVFESSTPGRI